MKIKNRAELLSHGDVLGKAFVLEIAEQTLEKLDA